MGSLAERYRKGGGPRPRHPKGPRGPLRKIVGFLTNNGNVFASDIVRLECGHTGRSWGGVRAHCRECMEHGKP